VSYSLGYDQAEQLITSQASPGVPSSTYVNQNYFAYDVAANRTGVQLNNVNRVKLGGTVTTGNALTITVNNLALTGGLKAITYTVVGGDTLSTIATKFAAQITADTDMQANGINASANGAVMSIKSASPNITSYAQSTSGGATETISLGVTGNFVENAVIGGSKTTGNTVTITVSDAALSGGQTAITNTVLAADTLTTIATGLKNAINANAGLTTAGITATSAGTAITIKSTSANATIFSIDKCGRDRNYFALHQSEWPADNRTGRHTNHRRYHHHYCLRCWVNWRIQGRHLYSFSRRHINQHCHRPSSCAHR